MGPLLESCHDFLNGAIVPLPVNAYYRFDLAYLFILRRSLALNATLLWHRHSPPPPLGLWASTLPFFYITCLFRHVNKVASCIFGLP